MKSYAPFDSESHTFSGQWSAAIVVGPNRRCGCPLYLYTHLVERLDLGVHDEGELAQFARRGLGGSEPLLQTRLVHILEASRAVARGEQRILRLALAVTDAANVAAILRRLAAARSESVGGGGGGF